jgi:hypothetical protein
MMMALLFSSLISPVLYCTETPEPEAEPPLEWHWRNVDGRKCWFQAEELLPREDLVWSYDEREFNERERATVKDQRHYTTRELQEWAEGVRRKERAARAAAEEAREEAREERQRQRQRRMQRRRERDDDDDD